MKKLKEEGITLIALIVTIIVLLVLAGVTITMLIGNNGILTQAINSKEKTEVAEIKEKLELAIIEYEIENNTSDKELAEYLMDEEKTGLNGVEIINEKEGNILGKYKRQYKFFNYRISRI